MSKRVANSKSKTKARNGRIRLGIHKKRMLNQLEELEKAERMQELDDEAKMKLQNFKAAVRKIIPKQFLRRQQGR